jgi:hypothetical protein
MALNQPELDFMGCRRGVQDSLTNEERADAWIHTKGGRMIMRDLYAIAAKFIPDWKRTGIPVSMKYLFEIERHAIKLVRARAQKMNVSIEKEYGYTLNNNYTASIARHILDHKPEWAGLFETRKTDDE